MSKRPIAIDLFAGAGGLSLGLEQAGFNVVASVEIDPIHAAAHKYNFPLCSTICESVENLTGKDILKRSNLDINTKVNLVAGGAPCQGFSLIGQRALDDPRNSLVKDYIRLIKELKPNYFLFENVKGLTVGKQKKFLEEIIVELSSIGYEIVSPWKVLNAKDFSVPQSRERLILVGAKKGQPVPDYPNPDNYVPVNCEEALGDLPDAESFEELHDSDSVKTSYLRRAKGYSALMRTSNEASWFNGLPRKWDKKTLTSSLRTNHTDISRNRFGDTEHGTIEKVSRFFKLSPEGVSNTLRAGTDSARGAFTSPRPIHYQYNRCITVREMARLHGFPDWFRFHETKWHGARQIGNAVPPPLARAVAEQIILSAGWVIPKQSEKIELGDQALLKLDMSKASKFFAIDVPIAKRDRKSGQKKRKQSEIS